MRQLSSRKRVQESISIHRGFASAESIIARTLKMAHDSLRSDSASLKPRFTVQSPYSGSQPAIPAESSQAASAAQQKDDVAVPLKKFQEMYKHGPIIKEAHDKKMDKLLEETWGKPSETQSPPSLAIR